MEIMDAEQKREKRLKTNEESLRELWDNVKCTSSHIVGASEGEEREGDRKIFQEITSKNFGNMGKNHSNPGSTMSTIENKPKEEHPETHINQTDQN